MRYTLLAVLLFVGTVMAGCGSRPATIVPSQADTELETFRAWLPGSYLNEAGGLPREVHIAKLPDFGPAYYVEEISGEPGVPLRQYVWMVRRIGDHVVAEHWTITRPGSYVGAWKSNEELLQFSMYYLRHRESCDMVFQYANERFAGQTRGSTCEQLVQGETRAVTSSAELAENEIRLKLDAPGGLAYDTLLTRQAE